MKCAFTLTYSWYHQSRCHRSRWVNDLVRASRRRLHGSLGMGRDLVRSGAHAMNPLVCLPLSYWLSSVAVIVAVVGLAVGVPVGVYCAKSGAKLAIKLCGEQNGCALRIADEKAQTTQDLEKYLQELHAKHPEILRARAAAQAILRDTDPTLPAMPDKEPPK